MAAEDNADRLEWACLAQHGYLAWTDVTGQLRRTMSEAEAVATYQESADGILDVNRPNIEPYEIILNDWVEVLSYRTHACGQDLGYPFIITEEGFEFRDSVSPAYVFQLLVSLGNNDRHHDGTTVSKLFEELSAAAAGKYLGDTRTTVVFGWPRFGFPKRFRDAVTALVHRLGEGVGCKDRDGLDDSKDDGLDIVAWREFPDRRPSKLILFGQCATGQLWKEKANELNPENWCKKNLVGTLAVNPVLAFFVPRALSEKDANDYGYGKILLDRFRISALCSGRLADGLDERLREWIATAVKNGIEFDAD